MVTTSGITLPKLISRRKYATLLAALAHYRYDMQNNGATLHVHALATAYGADRALSPQEVDALIAELSG
jgi:hypothetical protein